MDAEIKQELEKLVAGKLLAFGVIGIMDLMSLVQARFWR